jgi:hypothetical protein
MSYGPEDLQDVVILQLETNTMIFREFSQAVEKKQQGFLERLVAKVAHDVYKVVLPMVVREVALWLWNNRANLLRWR